MKQKNLLLMVVAVGCGLAAAFLTSQMSAGPRAEAPTMEIIVAKKVLVQGTKFTKDSLKDLVQKKKVNPADAPQNAVTTEDELLDKQLARTLRKDDFLSNADLGTFKQLEPPPGHDIITVRLPLEHITPFVKASSRVDVLGTAVTRANKVIGCTLVPSMLVLAVDLQTRALNDVNSGSMNTQVVTLAATPEEAQLVRMAEMANVSLSFLLKNPDAPDTKSANWSREGVRKWLDEMNGTTSAVVGGTDPEGVQKPQAVEKAKVSIHVPKADLPAWTELTADVIETKFNVVEFTSPAPDNVVVNLKDHLGKFLGEKVRAGLMIPKDAIADKKPDEKKDPPKAKPSDDDTAPKAPLATPEPKKPAKKFETFDRSFSGPSGSKTLRYQREEGKTEWKLLGEVQPDGSVKQSDGKPAGDAPKADEQPKSAPEGDGKLS